MTQTAVVQFNQDQLALIRQTVAKGTNEAEFRLFIEVCRYHQLNPFARQIYAVVRDGYNGRQLTIQTSIDGYRLLAERSGKYAGQMGPQWCDESGEWRDVWLSDKPPAAARVGVLRKDFDQPVWGVAKYRSYAQTKKDGTPTTMWQKMPDVMLAKCAESLALRKAFPAEMSGIYTAEEMQQADSHDLPTVPPLDTNTVEADPTTPAPAEQRQPAQQSKDSQQPTPREAKAAEPVPPPKATEQQIASIRKLCQHVQLSEPEDLEKMSYFAAKDFLAELTAEYKKQRTESQQSTSQPANAQAKALTDMISKAKGRVEAMDMNWADAKADAGFNHVADGNLTVQQVVKINGVIAQYERRAGGKAS